jgi:hypothetical protein
MRGHQDSPLDARSVRVVRLLTVCFAFLPSLLSATVAIVKSSFLLMQQHGWQKNHAWCLYLLQLSDQRAVYPAIDNQADAQKSSTRTMRSDRDLYDLS